jgi:hypothetical protein
MLGDCDQNRCSLSAEHKQHTVFVRDVNSVRYAWLSICPRYTVCAHVTQMHVLISYGVLELVVVASVVIVSHLSSCLAL